jgi:hypothetical protein
MRDIKVYLISASLEIADDNFLISFVFNVRACIPRAVQADRWHEKTFDKFIIDI